MKTHLLQLNSFDDSFSIMDKMNWSKANRILVVWPDAGKIRLSELDLILLMRKAESQGSQIAFVSDEQKIIETCKALGIQIFASIPEAYRKPWRRPKRLRKRNYSNSEEKDLAPLVNFFHKKWEPKPGITQWIKIGIFIVAISAFLALIGFFIPSAVVQVQADSKQVQLDLDVWANTSIDFPSISGALPVQVVSMERTASYQGISSGSMRIPNDFATGSLVFRNLTNSVISIPKGTVVLSSADPALRFQTTKLVTLKGEINAEAEVDGLSLSGGIIGNVPANTIDAIEGLIGGSVVVENRSAFSGGTELKTLSPSNEDYDKAKEELIEKMKQEVLEEIKNQYPQGFLFPETTLEVTKVQFEKRTPEIGQPGENFSYQLGCEFKIWMITRADVDEIAEKATATSLTGAYELVPGSLSLQMKTQPSFDRNGNLRWSITVVETARPLVDAEQIKNSIAGKKLEEAMTVLRTDSGLLPGSMIEISPAFWKRLPFLPFRLKVAINE
jgi:hypothetical protein